LEESDVRWTSTSSVAKWNRESRNTSNDGRSVDTGVAVAVSLVMAPRLSARTSLLSMEWSMSFWFRDSQRYEIRFEMMPTPHFGENEVSEGKTEFLAA
jgi:hypothetical protein